MAAAKQSSSSGPAKAGPEVRPKVRKFRHWKQRWNPKARMRFRKHLTLNGKKVKPGDIISEAWRKKLGEHRLRIWWEGGFIELVDNGPKKSRSGSRRKVHGRKNGENHPGRDRKPDRGHPKKDRVGKGELDSKHSAPSPAGDGKPDEG